MNMKILFGALGLMILLTACQKRVEPMAHNSQEKEIFRVLMPFEGRLERAWVAFQKADYDEVMGDASSQLDQKRARLLALYNDEANYEKLLGLHAKYAQDDTVDQDLNRVLSAWVQELSSSMVTDPELKAMQSQLGKDMDRLGKVRADFMTEVEDTEGKSQKLNFGETRQVLWKHPDRAYRERVFRARAKMGNQLLEAGLGKLIRARNEFARKIARARGAKDWQQYNFYRLKFEQFGLNLRDTFTLFQRLKEKTDLRLQEILAKAAANHHWKRVEPWDFDFIYASAMGENPLDAYFPAQVAEAHARTVFKELGFDLDQYALALDLYPRKAKGDNAGCFTIVAPQLNPQTGEVTKGDLRIYANLGQGGVEELSTLFHELGHAVHHAETRQFYWLDRNLERPAGTDYSLMEVPSTLFEKLPMLDEYVRRFAVKSDGQKPTASEIEQALKSFHVMEKDQFLLGWRQLLARVAFERAMYEADGQDLAKVWSRTMAEHLLVGRADEVNAWIERPHFVASPVYYQAYVLANLGSAQIFSYLKEKYGSFLGNPKIGEELKQGYFRYGRRYDYADLVEKVTGRPLSEAALVKMSM